MLFSFLDDRGRGYRKGMSSPITGESMCSRLSPTLVLDVSVLNKLFITLEESKKK